MRMKVRGSGFWGRRSVEATLIDAKTNVQLWVSKKQTGNRTVFQGYESPFTRAMAGILDQMKLASNQWPVH